MSAKNIKWKYLKLGLLVLAVTVLYVFMDAYRISQHPIYKKARIAEQLSIVREIRWGIQEYYIEHHKFPADLLTLGLNIPADFKSSMISHLNITSLDTGKAAQVFITITFNEKVDEGKTLIYSTSAPIDNADFIWDCRGGTLSNAHRFPECRN